MKKILSFFIVLLLIYCKENIRNQDGKETVNYNKFQNNILREIYELRDKQDTRQIEVFFNNEFPEYRKAAVLALSTICDTSSFKKFTQLLGDESKEVRLATVFAIGRLCHPDTEQELVKAFYAEPSLEVKSKMLETIGKCGQKSALSFLTRFQYERDDLLLLTGQIKGINLLADKGIISEDATKKAFELIQPEMPEQLRYIASFYFANATKTDLSKYASMFIESVNSEGFIHTKANLVLGMKNTENKIIMQLLLSILSTPNDYRIKVNAIEAIKSFNYQEIKDTILNLLLDSNTKIAIKASEYFIETGITEDVPKYLQVAKNTNSGQCKANMLTAALLYSSNKNMVSNIIIQNYNTSNSNFEKGYLLKTLSYYLPNYKFIASRVTDSENLLIRSFALQSIIRIRKSREYYEATAKEYSTISNDFLEVFKKALFSKQSTLIKQTANILREPRLKFNLEIKNTYFLIQALKNVDRKTDRETYIELLKTINYLHGEVEEMPGKTAEVRNWDIISEIPVIQNALVKTTKGDFTIRLLIEEAPVNVAVFVTLAKQNYYDQTYFYDVEPNFIVKGGCKTGDGFSSSGYSVLSEPSPLVIEEGYIGMVSSGENRESSRWFISMASLPRFDGKYTIIGKIINGIDILHKIEVGDKIEEIIVEAEQ